MVKVVKENKGDWYYRKMKNVDRGRQGTPLE